MNNEMGQGDDGDLGRVCCSDSDLVHDGHIIRISEAFNHAIAWKKGATQHGITVSHTDNPKHVNLIIEWNLSISSLSPV